MTEKLELERISEAEWVLAKRGEMRVPARVIADEETIAQLRQDTAERNCGTLLASQGSSVRRWHFQMSIPGTVSQSVGWLPSMRMRA